MDSGYSLAQVEIHYSANKIRLTALEQAVVEGYLARKTLKEIGKPYNLQPMQVKYVYSAAVSKIMR